MIKVYYPNCKKYKEFKKPKISYFFVKTFVIFIICVDSCTKHKIIFKEE